MTLLTSKEAVFSVRQVDDVIAQAETKKNKNQKWKVKM